MLAKLTNVLEKTDLVKKIPWKGSMIVIAVSFSLATICSVFLGKRLQPDGARNVLVQDTKKSNRSVGQKSSLNRSAVRSIVRRNIFNAEGKTGDDFDDDHKAKVPQIGEDAIKTTLPLKLHGIIYGGDPQSGIALIEDTSKRITNSFMFGDQIAPNVIVTQILEDRVIFARNDSSEYLLLIKKKFERSRRKKSAKKKSKSKKLSPIAVDPPPDIYKEEGFERNKNKIVMTQGFKKRMLTTDFARVLQDAKAEPNIVGGAMVGFKLTRIRQDSIYEKSGLQNGDIVTEINGMELSGAGLAIKMLNGLKSESEIEIRIDRGGTFLNILVVIPE